MLLRIVFSLFLLGLAISASPAMASDTDARVALSLASAARQRTQKQTQPNIPTPTQPTKPEPIPETPKESIQYYEQRWINGNLYLIPIQSSVQSFYPSSAGCESGSLK